MLITDLDIRVSSSEAAFLRHLEEIDRSLKFPHASRLAIERNFALLEHCRTAPGVASEVQAAIRFARI